MVHMLFLRTKQVQSGERATSPVATIYTIRGRLPRAAMMTPRAAAAFPLDQQ